LEHGVFQWIHSSEQERGHDSDAQSVQRYEDDERNHNGQNERNRALEALVVRQNIPLRLTAIPTLGQLHTAAALAVGPVPGSTCPTIKRRVVSNRFVSN